jgi:predicted GH43/DUF377 family glycosyl hydrolase
MLKIYLTILVILYIIYSKIITSNQILGSHYSNTPIYKYNKEASKFQEYYKSLYYPLIQLRGTVQKILIGPFSLTTHEKFHVFNPSIILVNNKILVVARLSSNSHCQNTSLKYTYSPLIEKSTNVFNPNYKFNSSLLIYFNLDTPFIYNVINNYHSNKNEDISLGMEDPRLFTFQNEPWIYFHYRGFKNDTFIHLPAIFKMSEPQNIIYLYYEKMTQLEKNWMPFEFNNKLYFEYNIHPHIILECDISTGICTLIAITTFINPLQKEIGGGAPSQLVTQKQCYLGIGHTRVDSIRKNFFYTFNPISPFNITGMSEEINIESNNNIEFVSGLIVHNNTIILSAGIQDCYSVIAKYDMDYIFNLIKPFNFV